MSAHFIRLKIFSAALAALTALAVSGEALAQRAGPDGVPSGAPRAEAAAEAVGQCTPGRLKYKTLDDSVSTNSTSSVNVPGSGIVFVQGGVNPSCVVVRFSAQAFASITAGRLMYVRAVIGSTVAEPGEVQFTATNDTFSRSHSFEWVFPNVAPGKRTVRIQFRSLNGEFVYMQDRTTIIHYHQ